LEATHAAQVERTLYLVRSAILGVGNCRRFSFMGTVVSSDIQHPFAAPEAPIAAASAAAVASTKDTTSHRPASVEFIAKVAAGGTQTPFDRPKGGSD
jgi:hypothetical protein